MGSEEVRKKCRDRGFLVEWEGSTRADNMTKINKLDRSDELEENGVHNTSASSWGVVCLQMFKTSSKIPDKVNQGHNFGAKLPYRL